MEHQKEKLSEYLDDALGAKERKAVETHLSACADCKAELESLREVSKLVAGLPKEPLPTGFLERLQRRREGASSAPAGAWLAGWTPVHSRAAAFAAAGVVALFIGFREVRFRSAAVSSMQSLDAAPALTEGDASEREYWRKDVHAKGEPLLNTNEASPAADIDGAARSAASGFAAGGEGLAALRAAGAARGAGALVAPPIPAPKKTVASNEAIQDFLARDRDKMGIREILPSQQGGLLGGGAADEEGAPQQPMAKDEAMQYLRNMTQQISKLNADRANKINPSVAVADTRKPRLLADDGASRPLTVAAAPMEAAPDSFLLARAKGAAGVRAASPKLEADMKIAHKEVAAKREVPAIPRYQEAAPAGSQWTRSWAGAASGLTSGGSAAKDASQWEGLWFRLGLEGPPPAVDFKEDMVVVVVGAEGQSVGIESLRPQGPNLWVSYRATMAKDAQAGKLPFHAVVVPRSDLDVSAQEIR